jgi:anti-sigma B factor antagonist
MAWLWQRTKPESPNSDFRTACRIRGAECVVSLSGRITIDSSPDLRARLLDLLQSPNCQALTVDFGEVSYIDTSGLAVLFEVLKAVRSMGKRFCLSRLRERPRYLLEATRLLHLFEEVNLEEPSGKPQ